MTEDIDIYTVTLAKVYAKQGYLEKAASIYRHLLEQEPERQDLIDGLSEIEKKRFSHEKKDPAALVLLFSEWVDLAFGINKLKTLNKIRGQISEGSFWN